MRFQIYISNATSDDTIAIAVKRLLRRIFLNADVTLASRDPSGGRAWLRETRDRLNGSAVIIALMTPFSKRSPWVLLELGAGFFERKGLILCTDGIMLQDIEPPLNLLTARTASETGLQSLMEDISRIAELPEPTAYPGIEETLNDINNFLLVRNQSIEDEQRDGDMLGTGEFFSGESTPMIIGVDPEIANGISALDEKLQAIMVKRITDAIVRPNFPAKPQLDNMILSELIELATAHNIPFPNQEVRCFQYLKLTSLSANQAPWKKLNFVNKIEDTLANLMAVEREGS